MLDSPANILRLCKGLQPQLWTQYILFCEADGQLWKECQRYRVKNLMALVSFVLHLCSDVIKIPLRTQPRLHILRRPGTGPKASAAYQDQWKGYRMFCGRLLQVDWHPTSQFAPLRYCSPTAPPSGRGLIQLVVKTWIHSATMQKKEALLEDKTEFTLIIPKTSKNQYSHVDHLLLGFFRAIG